MVLQQRRPKNSLVYTMFAPYSTLQNLNFEPESEPYYLSSTPLTRMAAKSRVTVLRVKRKASEDPLELIRKSFEFFKLQLNSVENEPQIIRELW